MMMIDDEGVLMMVIIDDETSCSPIGWIDRWMHDALLSRPHVTDSYLCGNHPRGDLLFILLCGLDEEHFLLHPVSVTTTATAAVFEETP